MSDRFTAAQGRKVVSRASAEELGNVGCVLVDVEHRRVASLVVGKRRKARLVDWENVSACGVDAVMISDEASLRDPRDEREQAAAKGRSELLGKRVLTDLGDGLGVIDDVIFDPESGALEAFVVGGHDEPADSLLGAGSYALILRAPEAEAEDPVIHSS